MKKALFVLFVLLISFYGIAQTKGQLHGNFQTDVYLYENDSLINAERPPHQAGIMGYANFIYNYGNFTAGVRYETYLNTPEGFDSRYDGEGIPYRYLQYETEKYKIIVGNFYEQFGSGLILRSYEDKTLGVDNSIDGMLASLQPVKGITLKGLVGKQRFFWDKGSGIVRGVDGEVSIASILPKLSEKSFDVIIGGSAVSKYEQDLDPVYKLPENVMATAGRMSVSYKNLLIKSEYVYKINDPSADNGYIYQNGQALMLSGTYSRKGFGVILQAKSLYNMSFRSSRNANLNNLMINYIPAITKTQSYSLAAMYPYASQPNGETGFQADVFYRLPKKTVIGGKYGTAISMNFSYVGDINKTPVADTIALGQPGTLGYNAKLFSMGNELYYKDFNIEINRKISKHIKTNFMYQNVFYNYDVLRGKVGHENVLANVGVADISYKINSNNDIKTQIQALFTKQDFGNWAMALLQYTFKRQWFVAVLDQYNYGNPEEIKRIHYYNFILGYTHGASRIQLGYGKQREGIMCVGGVCREVPAMYGFTLNVSTSF